MTLLTLTLARRAAAYAALDPVDQRDKCRTHAHHLAVYAQARRWSRAHPPAEPPLGSGVFGALDSIPATEASVYHE